GVTVKGKVVKALNTIPYPDTTPVKINHFSLSFFNLRRHQPRYAEAVGNYSRSSAESCFEMGFYEAEHLLTLSAEAPPVEVEEKIESMMKRIEELEKRYARAELLRLYAERRMASGKKLREIEKEIERMEKLFTEEDLDYIKTLGLTKKEKEEYEKLRRYE
ncbi:MAG: hypothetical protein ABIM59_07945, partial [candidate division WOR-3 bacterium]